jgi:hypothetical protein
MVWLEVGSMRLDTEPGRDDGEVSFMFFPFSCTARQSRA